MAHLMIVFVKAHLMIVFVKSTHKHTSYLFTYIILPLPYMRSNNLPSSKLSASMLSASMDSLGNDVKNSSFTNIYEISELVGFKIEIIQGLVHQYQASPRATDDKDVKVMIQELKREVDSKFESIVGLVSSRNEEVMRQITLMSEKFDSLCVKL